MTFKDFNALLVRLFLGYLFTSSGLCKLTDGHFGQLIGPPLLIDQLTPHGLRTFAFFIAISQVMTGALVLSQRYSVLGLIMLIPMNLSIIMVTISQNWRGTPYVDALFTTLNLLALLYEWHTLKFLLFPENKAIQHPSKVNSFFTNRWFPLGIVGIFGICCLTARYSYAVTTVSAVIAYVLVYFHVFRSQPFTWSYSFVLGMSLFAIIAVTLVGYSVKWGWPFNPMLLIGIPIFGTFIAYFLALGWYSVRQWKARLP